jgi:hypothetical protein
LPRSKPHGGEIAVHITGKEAFVARDSNGHVYKPDGSRVIYVPRELENIWIDLVPETNPTVSIPYLVTYAKSQWPHIPKKMIQIVPADPQKQKLFSGGSITKFRARPAGLSEKEEIWASTNGTFEVPLAWTEKEITITCTKCKDQKGEDYLIKAGVYFIGPEDQTLQILMSHGPPH